MKKQCSKCLLFKEPSEFYKKYVKTKNQCKVCLRKVFTDRYKNDSKFRAEKIRITREWVLNNAEKYLKKQLEWSSTSPKGIYSRINETTKKRKLGEIISQKDFIDWYISQEKKCFYCDIPENILKKVSSIKNRKRLSIDRLDSSIGYLKNNLVLACMSCNMIKSSLLSSSEMREIGQKYIKPKWKNNQNQN